MDVCIDVESIGSDECITELEEDELVSVESWNTLDEVGSIFIPLPTIYVVWTESSVITCV